MEQAMEQANACQRLWLAAINRAFLDASGSAKRVEIDGARQWLLSGNADLAQACDLAGLNAAVVSRKAEEMQSRGWELAGTSRMM